MDSSEETENLPDPKTAFVPMDFAGEFKYHKQVLEKNTKAIIDKIDTFLDLISCNNIDDSLMEKGLNARETLNTDQQSVINKTADLVTLKDKYINRKQSVAHLEVQLKRLQSTLGKLKDSHTIDKTCHQSSLEKFQKALQYYTLYFNFTIKIEDKSEKNKYTIIVTFDPDDGSSSSPVKFIIDKKDDTLLDFNASHLMTSKQKKLLFNNFKATNNYLTLFYNLRVYALKKKEQ